jgi:DNA repair exonuclease SbcCD ATPase subunit
METIPEIKNIWQLLAMLTTGLFGLFGFWIQHNAAESKKLVAETEKLEIERTNHRKTIRDNQISEIRSQILGIGKSLDRHLDDHKTKDDKLQSSIDNLCARIRFIEDNLIERKEFNELKNDVQSIDKNIVRLCTMIDERTNKIA